MAKVLQLNLPPEFDTLTKKSNSPYNLSIHPVIGMRNKHNTRGALKRNQGKQFITAARLLWAELSTYSQSLWTTAAAFRKLSGFAYFLEKYSYSQKNLETFESTPGELAQMYGLKISDPDYNDLVQAIYLLPDIVGPLQVSCSHKQIENSPTGPGNFEIAIMLDYFESGENKRELYLFDQPSGNYDWTQFNQYLGIHDKKYWQAALIFQQGYYNAEHYIDNLLIQDASGERYREPFTFRAGKQFQFPEFNRTKGWILNPGSTPENIQVVYLEG